MSLSDPNLIIEAALRNDARLGREPRYSTASVLPIHGQRPTIQQRIETLIFQQTEARAAYFSVVADRDDLIVRMARRNLRDVDSAAVDSVQIRVAHAEVQYARINELLLDAEQTLDCLLHDDMTDALHGRLRALTEPTGDGSDSAQILSSADYGIQARA